MRGDWTSAEKELIQIQPTPEAIQDILRVKASFYSRQGRREAEGLYQALLETDVVEPEDRVAFAEHLIRMGSADRSITLLRDAIQLQPDCVPAIELLANVCAETGKASAARRASDVLALALGENIDEGIIRLSPGQ